MTPRLKLLTIALPRFGVWRGSPLAAPRKTPQLRPGLNAAARLSRLGFEQAGLKLLIEPEAFTFNIDADRMVEQACRG